MDIERVNTIRKSGDIDGSAECGSCSWQSDLQIVSGIIRSRRVDEVLGLGDGYIIMFCQSD